MKPIQTAAFNQPEYEVKQTGAYRPRVSQQHLRHIRLIKGRTNKSMNKIVAEALDFYFEHRVGW